MSKSSQVDGDGYTVEVSLLKFKPVAVALSAAGLIGLVSFLGWLGFSGSGQLVASKAVRNHASNDEFRDTATIPNSATSQDTNPARIDDRSAADERRDDATEADVDTVNKTASASELTSNPSKATGLYTVQAGSFASSSEANERVSSLRAAGFEAHVVAVELGKRGTWYRVYTGGFESREEASRHEKKLRASGAVGDTMITPVQE